MRFAVIVAFIGLLAAAPAAGAASPTRVSGVRLTWPAKTSFAPGERVSLRVSSSRHSARVAFLDGRRVLVSRTLRRGTFSAKVPPGDGKTYTLRVTILGRRFSAPVTTPPRPVNAPAMAPTPTATPEPQPGPPEDCSTPSPYNGGATGTLSPLSGRPGDAIRLTILTTGPGCTEVAFHPELGWARLDGTPIPIEPCSNTVLTDPPPPPTCVSFRDTWSVPPRKTLESSFEVPNGLEPGTYKVATSFASAEFVVLGSGAP